MIIYRIYNTVNGKSYIGQSNGTFKARYNNKWWKNTKSRLLKEDVKIYGKDNFSVELLESNVQSRKDLNALEIFYIKKYDSFGEKGYNLTRGGCSKYETTNESKMKLSQKKRGTLFFELLNQKTGELIKIYNLSSFCRERPELNIAKISEVWSGKRIHHKFWTLPSTIMRFWILENSLGRTEKIFGFEVLEFARKENLSKSSVEGILCGYIRKGWKLKHFQPNFFNGKEMKYSFPKSKKGPLFEEIYLKRESNHLLEDSN